MSARLFLAAGAAFGLIAVGLGAFGAHALKDRLAADLLAVWRTAVEYQMYHALALVAVGLWAREVQGSLLNAAGACFAIGIVLFSGSLYALALTGVRTLGAITPLGGVLFLAGWACLLVEALRR